MTDPRYRNIEAGLLLVLLLFAAHAIYLNVIAEDAFISFRYARNLADGHGLVWNPGEAAVEGYTNFLWVLICAAAIKLDISLLPFVQAAGIVIGLLTILTAFLFARDILRLSPAAALLPPLLLAVSGPFAAWSASGMETGLFTLLLLAGAYHACRYRQELAPERLHLSSLLLLAATLTRPEGTLVFLVLLAWGVLYPGRRGGNRAFIRTTALYCVPLLLYTLWRFNYFGMLLPNTFYAKTGGGWRQYARGGVYSCFFALSFILPLLPAAILAWRRRRLQDIRNRFAVITCCAICGWYASYIIAVGGDYMAMYRFFVPLLPFIYLLFAAVTVSLIEGRGGGRLSAAATAWLCIALLATALHSTPLEKRLLFKPPRQHGTWRGIETERWHVNRLSHIGSLFASATAPGARKSIATPAIGAISYYAQADIYGFFGITDSHIARRPVTTPGATIGWPGHEKEDFRYLFSKNPTYVVFSRLLTAEPQPFPEYQQLSLAAQLEPGGPAASPDPLLDAFIREHYDLMALWTRDKKNQEEGYFTFLALKRRYR